MKKYFGCDDNKNYSIFTSLSEDGTKSAFFRVENNRSEFRHYLDTLPLVCRLRKRLYNCEFCQVR